MSVCAKKNTVPHTCPLQYLQYIHSTSEFRVQYKLYLGFWGPYVPVTFKSKSVPPPTSFSTPTQPERNPHQPPPRRSQKHLESWPEWQEVQSAWCCHTWALPLSRHVILGEVLCLSFLICKTGANDRAYLIELEWEWKDLLLGKHIRPEPRTKVSYLSYHV